MRFVFFTKSAFGYNRASQAAFAYCSGSGGSGFFDAGAISIELVNNRNPGLPSDNLEQYMKRSPLSCAGNVKTPTMLLNGEVDYRTPISESEQFYTALKLAGAETAMVRFPEASHGIANRPGYLMSKVLHIPGWFERYRNGDGKNRQAFSDRWS